MLVTFVCCEDDYFKTRKTKARTFAARFGAGATWMHDAAQEEVYECPMGDFAMWRAVSRLCENAELSWSERAEIATMLDSSLGLMAVYERR